MSEDKKPQVQEEEIPQGGPLYNRLRAHGVSLEEVNKAFPYVGVLTTRVLGTPPRNTYPVFFLDPEIYGMYNYFIPRFANIPGTDFTKLPFNSSRVDPLVRAAALYAGSAEYECNYCMNHCCSIGDVMSGARIRDEVGDNPTTVNPKATDLAVKIAHAAAKTPGEVTSEMREKAVKQYGEKGFKEIAGFCAMMGWLNFVMQFMASPVETFFTTGGRQRKDLGTFEPITNIGKLFQTLNAAAKVATLEKKWFSQGIPKDVDKWMETKFGEVPVWFKQSHQNCKEALQNMLQQTVFNEKNNGLTTSEKVNLWLAYAEATKNAVLVQDIKNMAEKQQIDVTSTGGKSDKMNFGLLLVDYVSAVPHPPLTDELADEMFAVNDNEAVKVADMMSTIASFVTYHRIANVLA